MIYTSTSGSIPRLHGAVNNTQKLPRDALKSKQMPSARRVSWAKFRVTFVLIAAVAIMAVLFSLLTGGTLLKQKTNLYVYVPDASGISPGSAVSVSGIGVGKVTDVRLSGSSDPNRTIRLTLRLETDKLATIPADSYVQIDTNNVVGDRYVDVNQGKSSEHIQPGAELPFRPQVLQVRSLDLTGFEKQLRVMEATLTDIEAGKGSLGQFVMTDKLYKNLLASVDRLETVVKSATATTSPLGELTYTDQLYRHIRAPFAELDDLLTRIETGQSRFRGLLYDEAQYASLQARLADLRQTVAGLQKKPFLQSDDMYNAWNQAIASMIQSVAAFNSDPLLMSSDVYDNLNGEAKQIRDTTREFRENPQKFLRIKLF